MERTDVKFLGLNGEYPVDKYPDGYLEDITNFIAKKNGGSVRWEVLKPEQHFEVEEIDYHSGLYTLEHVELIRLGSFVFNNKQHLISVQRFTLQGTGLSDLIQVNIHEKNTYWDEFQPTSGNYAVFDKDTITINAMFSATTAQIENLRDSSAVLIKSPKNGTTLERFFDSCIIHVSGWNPYGAESYMVPNILPYIKDGDEYLGGEAYLANEGEVLSNNVSGFLTRTSEGAHSMNIAMFYAIRLKTGELVGHSAVSSVYLHSQGISPAAGEGVYTYLKYNDDGYRSATFDINSFRFDEFKSGTSITYDELEKSWLDRVDTVEIYLCPPIVTTGETDSSQDPINNVFYLAKTLTPTDSWLEDKDREIKINHEDLLSKRVAEIDAYTRHRFSANTIGSYNSKLVLGGVFTDFSVPCDMYNHRHEGFDFTIDQTIEGYVIVTIKAGDETFTRGAKVSFNNYATDITRPAAYLCYPDSRATQIELVVRVSDSNWKYQKFPLQAAKTLNLAYINTRLEGAFPDPIQDSGSSYGSEGTVQAQYDNSKLYYEPNKIKVSGLSPNYYPLENTFEVGSDNEDIISVLSNDSNVSEGQFGQFPMYVFKRNSIHALNNQGSVDALFSEVVPISTNIGAIHHDSIARGLGTVYFASYNNSNNNSITIYGLQGQSVKAIDDAIIDHDFFEGVELHDTFTNREAPIVLGYNNKTFELYISRKDLSGSPKYNDKILVYNDRFNVWYFKKMTDNDPSLPRHYFNMGAIDSENLDGTKGLAMVKQSTDDHRGKVVSMINYQDDVSSEATLNTKLMSLGTPNGYKKVRDILLRATLLAKTGESYTVKLYGKKKDHSEQLLVSYDISGTDFPSVDDLVLKSKLGSFQFYRFEIDGNLLPESTIEGLEIINEKRYTHKLRR